MIDFAAILVWISMSLGINTIPADNQGWSESAWKKTEHGYEFTSTSQNILEACNKSPDSVIVFPQVIHGVHQVWIDGKLVLISGDPTFEKASAFYEKPYLECNKHWSGPLVWSVTSYSKYFARFSSFPKVAAISATHQILNVVSNFVAASGLLFIAAFSLLAFFGKTNNQLVWSISSGSALIAIYFALTVSPYFDLNVSMLNAHKLADSALWLGAIFYMNFFRVLGYLPSRFFAVFSASAVAAVTIILLGQNGDQIQFGTIIPFSTSLIALYLILQASVETLLKNKQDKRAWFVFTGNCAYVFAAGHDMFHIFGVINSASILPLGSAAAVFLMALTINREVEAVYDDRDQLLKNLENLVNQKTHHLSEALDSLKTTQAELIQSARLASLGTLSAGIAHEINNSINYVNGALPPLEKIILKNTPEAESAKVRRLLEAIKQGTSLTVEIVRSLRNYTGLNQATKKDVVVLESVTSILTILKSKIRATEVQIDVPSDIVVFGHTVGINQIFMNIISNALDVLPAENGRITVSAAYEGSNVIVKISDNGCGMSEEVRSRIFDPFFTTKDVGKGTGLGLHIVKKEIERHQGDISVESKHQAGTTFIISLPRQENTNTDAQEAA